MSVKNYEIIGIEKRDIRVYEQLFGMEDASLRSLAEHTGLNRGTVYEIIKKLTDLGLVTFTQQGDRRRYGAADPKVLQALISERQEQLGRLERQTADYIEQLNHIKKGKAASFFAQFYEGNEGVASILRDVLQTVSQLDKKEYCVISAKSVSMFLYANFKSFSAQRIRQGVTARVLADRPAKRVALSERRQLSGSNEPLNGYVILYGDKTAFISLGEANRLSGIVIDDKGITSMQKIIFNKLWEGCSK